MIKFNKNCAETPTPTHNRPIVIIYKRDGRGCVDLAKYNNGMHHYSTGYRLHAVMPDEIIEWLDLEVEE